MRTESALQEMDKAVETLLEQLTAETNMETTGSETSEPLNNRYTHYTSNKTAIVTLSSI